MANRYIRAGIERDIYLLNVQDIPNFVNDTLRKEVDRIKKMRGDK